ncbi:MAG: hypothetical protein ABFD18_05800, partial [Syntrophomonas sp.]
CGVLFLSKYQKAAGALCLLGSVSLIFGQAAKSIFINAPLFGWLLGGIFIILALFMAAKACAKH